MPEPKPSVGAALPLLLLFLVAPFALTLRDPPGHSTPFEAEPDGRGPDRCCSNYTLKAISCRAFKCYFYEGSLCHLQAVILVTRRDQEVCANPGDKWVQGCLRHLPGPGC